MDPREEIQALRRMAELEARAGGGAAPAAEPTWGDRGREFLQGGKGRIGEMGLGIKGLAVPISQAEKDAVKIPDTWAGTAGSVAADIGTMLIPGGAFVKATQGLKLLPRALANLGFNAGTAAALVPENRDVAAAFGAAGGVVGDAVGSVVRKLAPYATAAGRAERRENRAGRALVRALGDDAATTAEKLQAYMANRSGIAADVPLTTAQAVRQAEGDAAGRASSALSKLQAGTASAAAPEYTELLRAQNKALHGVTARAGADASKLVALKKARAAATQPMRENALNMARQDPDLAGPLRATTQGVIERDAVGGDAYRVAQHVMNTLESNPSPERLYALRKDLAKKLQGPVSMNSGDLTSAAKNAEVQTLSLIKAIDDRLQQASSRSYAPVQTDMLAEGVERWPGIPARETVEGFQPMHADPANQRDLFGYAGDTNIEAGAMDLYHPASGNAPFPRYAGSVEPDQMPLFGREGQIDMFAIGREPYRPKQWGWDAEPPGEAIPHGPNQIPLIPPEVQRDVPGQWTPYLQKFGEMSKPVESARVQGRINEFLENADGPLVGDLGEMTRNRLTRALKMAEDKKFGTDKLTPEARARYDEAMKFMQRNEEAMRSTKNAASGGGGSPTEFLQSASMEAAPSVIGGIMSAMGVPGAGSGIGLARVGSHVMRAETKRELAQLMLSPERAVAGIRAALAQNKPLSEAQVAFRAFMRTQGTAAGAGAARE
jgi:hypothetical protein